MRLKHIRLLALLMVAALAPACTSVGDPMALLPISEQAYLKTMVPAAPQAQPVSVDQMLQNALVATGTVEEESAEEQDAGMAAIEDASQAPLEAIDVAPARELVLAFGSFCESSLNGDHLVALGEFRRGVETVEGLAGRIAIPSGSGSEALCAFQRAGEIVRLLEGALVDIVIVPVEGMDAGRLLIVAEPLA